MRPIQFLINRNGVYYFRRVVPISLRSILNRREIVLTLKTSDFKDACMAALGMSKELDALFSRLKQGVELITPSEQDLFAAVVKTRRTQALLKEALVNFNERKSEDIEWEALHCRTFRQEILDDLAKSNLKAGQEEVTELLKEIQQEISETTLIQLQRAAMQGLADFYVNAEIIVRGELENPLLWQQPEPETTKTDEPSDSSELNFETAFDHFISERKLYCSDKQLNSIHAHYNYFMRFLTEEDGVHPNARLLASVTSQVAREFKEHLRKSPANINKKYKGLSIGDAVAAAQSDGSPSLAVTTQGKFLQHLSSLYAFAADELEYSGKNPFHGRADNRLAEQHSRDARNPFSEKQLTTLFTSPLYTGCKSLSSCDRPGKLIPKTSYKFWLPLIGLYSGMRLQEITQLRIEDIQKYKDIWLFDINARHEDQKLKTPQSARKIPIHEDLIKLGLLERVEQLRDSQEERLFPDITKASDGTYSGNPSKWFARYSEKVGIKTNKTSFHSFRHNIKDNFRNTGESDELSEHFCGRKTGSTAERYGSAYSIERFYEALHKLEFNFVQGPNKENKTCT